MKKNLKFFGLFRKQSFLKLLITMKLSLILLCITLLQVNALTYSQEITIKNKSTKLVDLLSIIEDQSHYKFLYEDELIENGSILNIDVQNKQVTDILDEILITEDLNYTVFDDNLIVITRSKIKVSQSKTISGTVTDGSTGEPLIGANVILKGTTNGTVTDVMGNYSIDVPAEDTVLVFSYVGYIQEEAIVGEQQVINITLIPDVKSLQEIVVVGYGTQISRLVTGSVQQVGADEIGNQPVGQLTQSLQGKFSGVQINQVSGKPGGGMTVRIRGQASITAGNQPLYVIDGMPIVGDISDINPNEIESISVLKDAAATSLYGSRAANGVILIETIKGKAGQTKINFNAYYGVQQVPQKGRPDMMNAREFAQFKKEIAEFNGNPVDEAFQNPEQYGEGTDWFDVLMQTAPIQNYSLSMSTGTQKFNTSAIASYFNQEGVVVNTGFERYSLRVNSVFKPNDILTIGFNVAPSYSITTNPNTDGTWLFGAIINSAVLTSPMAKAVNEDGSLPLDANAPGMWPMTNWLRTAKERVMNTKGTRLLSNAYIELEPLKDLKIKSTINADLGNSRYHEFYPSTVGGIFAPPPQIPSGRATNTNFFSWVNENTMVYTKEFGEHTFDFLAGFTAQNYSMDMNDISASQFPDDKVEIISAAGQTETDADIQEWSLLSYLARLNYNYRQKYIISMAFRRDGSSRFGADNKWGNFPSVSLGWVLSEEEFMPDIDAINLIKLRGSYGVVGNFNIGNYTHYSNITSTNYAFGDTPATGRSITNLGDSELGWEINKQVDIGLDINILNYRIQFTYDYFRKKTTDLLYSVEIPQSSGFSEIQTNIGEIAVWGHEFLVSTRNLVGTFKWNTDFNISFTRNEVISLGLDNAPLYTGEELTSPYVTMVGQPVGIFYGMVHQGVYVDQTDYDNSPKHTSSQVGTVKFKDVDGNGIITQDDREILGSPHPDFIFGITSSMYYKNFDLSIIISGSYGNKIAARTEQYSTNLDGVFNVLAEVQDHWRSPEDPGSGKYGSLAAGTTYLERDWFSSRFLYDGSYLAIKNITLGYTIPLENTKIFKNFRVYSSIQQAAIFTKYKGNPEVNITREGEATSSTLTLGSDFSGYPVPRTFSLGVNIGF